MKSSAFAKHTDEALRIGFLLNAKKKVDFPRKI